MPPGFEAGERTMLFFERDGMEGIIRGAIVLSGERILDVLLFESREGLRHTALDETWLESFRDYPAKPPVVVDAVSGATVSSRAVMDAVNERLTAWRDARELDD